MSSFLDITLYFTDKQRGGKFKEKERKKKKEKRLRSGRMPTLFMPPNDLIELEALKNTREHKRTYTFFTNSYFEQ